MPTRRHETLIELFRRRPSLAAEILTEAFEIKVPGWQDAVVTSGDLSELLPTEYRADSVTVLSDAARQPVQAVVLEVQLKRDDRKLRSWPAYVATLYARWGCPTALLVVCPAPATAAWAARPIEMGPGSLVTPLVLGPERVPVVTDVSQAADSPELAVLSAMAHGKHPQRREILQALCGALRTIDHEHADMYTDLVAGALPKAARRLLEEMMDAATYEPEAPIFRRFYLRGKALGMAEGKGEGRAEGRAEGREEGRAEGLAEGLTEGRAEGLAEGRAEGEAAAVLAVLAARGIEVPEAVRDRILECTDLGQLDTWTRRAATAASLHEVFDEAATAPDPR